MTIILHFVYKSHATIIWHQYNFYTVFKNSSIIKRSRISHEYRYIVVLVIINGNTDTYRAMVNTDLLDSESAVWYWLM